MYSLTVVTQLHIKGTTCNWTVSLWFQEWVGTEDLHPPHPLQLLHPLPVPPPQHHPHLLGNGVHQDREAIPHQPHPRPTGNVLSIYRTDIR